ncbi:hypothetical protein, conserved [Eimeria necatrix]|uniref:Vacuolar protein 14 C-terminal Fig4-binding domain-containing protein n=1 Tax=Eimeria necatrix TaxID=51315 RepID=U6N0Y1_9EIME|nr:hypothetical protein, conserved [Eimeria necatrix]CDJ67570.1 hypothetical protein, conserved [Eimeria necatrix]
MYGSSAEFPVAGPLFGKENCRGLADKSFEKRKAAAHALQHVIKQQVSTAVATANNEEACAPADALTGDSEQNETATPSHRQRQQQRLQEKHREATQSIVQQATSALTADFLSSPIANIRKGGLLGVAAVGLAFESGGLDCCLQLLLRPLLKSFGDPDPRVRYYACESLFNVLKAARGLCLQFLPELFDGLCKLCGDVDREVRQGVGFVDSLLKEETAAAAAAAAEAAAAPSLAEPEALKGRTKAVEAPDGPITPAFVHLLVERLLVRNPYIKLLALSWISLLESHTGVDMLQYLPLFLGGLLQLLGDSHRDIRQAADLCVTNFLEDLRSVPVETDPAVVKQTAEVVLQCSDSSNSSFTQLTSLVWLHELLLLLLPDEGQQQQQQQQHDLALPETPIIRWHLEVQKQLKPLGCRMLQSILRCAADQEEEIARLGTEVHAHVIARVLVSTAALDLSDFVSSAARYLRTYTPPGSMGSAAPTDSASTTAAGQGGDVRSLCLQWMELMLVEKPHLLLVGSPQEEQQKIGQTQQRHETALGEGLLQTQQHEEGCNEEDAESFLLQKQQPLVAAVLYTSLTTEGTAGVAAAAAAEEGPTTAVQVQEASGRQESTTTPTAGSAPSRAAATGARAAATVANHLLRMSLSILSRFVQQSDTNLKIVAEELLALFKSNRSLLDSRGHFVLRQLCTMRNPCEVYIHLSRQIERLYETARPGQNKAARKEASGEGCAAQNHAMKVTGSSEEADGVQAELSDDFLEQSVQFSQQIVQALSIDLLSAKEMEAARQELRKDDNRMFEALLPTWAHNSIWLIALSLYSGKFQVAESLVVMLEAENGLDKQAEALVSRALSLAKAARDYIHGEVFTMTASETDHTESHDPKELANLTKMRQQSSTNLQKATSAQSLEAALDEALTEHGSALRAFPSIDSDT